MENNQSSVGERVWNAAEAAGAERRKKIETTINRVLGLPEAAGKLVEIGTDAAKAKRDELIGKANDLAERTNQRVTEVWDRGMERFETTRDNLISRVEAFSKRVGDKATELKNRAIKAGIETGLKIEDKIVAICELPADLKEVIAKKDEEKASGLEEKKEATLAKQFAVENGLSEAQQRALEKMLARQSKKMESVAEKHGAVSEKLSGKIEAAKNKSQEHKDGAAKIRGAVETRRVFKGLLDKI